MRDLVAAQIPSAEEGLMKPFRILIADDHEVVRHGLRVLLQEHEGWEICGEAVDGRDAAGQGGGA